MPNFNPMHLEKSETNKKAHRFCPFLSQETFMNKWEASKQNTETRYATYSISQFDCPLSLLFPGKIHVISTDL